MGTYLWFSNHVCHNGCDGPDGCLDARREQGRWHRVKIARAICESCSVRQECLDYALKNRIPFGIWGAKTERERLRMLRAERRNGANNGRRPSIG